MTAWKIVSEHAPSGVWWKFLVHDSTGCITLSQSHATREGTVKGLEQYAQHLGLSVVADTTEHGRLIDGGEDLSG